MKYLFCETFPWTTDIVQGLQSYACVCWGGENRWPEVPWDAGGSGLAPPHRLLRDCRHRLPPPLRHLHGGHQGQPHSVLRIRDVYPGSDFWLSRIPDLGSKNSNKREGWKKICCPIFFWSHKNHKIEYYINFELVKKKNSGQFAKNYRTFYPNRCHRAFKDKGLGSGIQKKPIPDPGVKKAPDPGSGSATLFSLLWIRIRADPHRFSCPQRDGEYK